MLINEKWQNERLNQSQMTPSSRLAQVTSSWEWFSFLYNPWRKPIPKCPLKTQWIKIWSFELFLCLFMRVCVESPSSAVEKCVSVHELIHVWVVVVWVYVFICGWCFWVWRGPVISNRMWRIKVACHAAISAEPQAGNLLLMADHGRENEVHSAACLLGLLLLALLLSLAGSHSLLLSLNHI